MFCEQQIAQQSRDEDVDHSGEREARGKRKCVEVDESFEAPQNDPTVRDRQLHVQSPVSGTRTTLPLLLEMRSWSTKAIQR